MRRTTTGGTRSGSPTAVAFDPAKGVASGPHVEIGTGVQVTGAALAQYAVSNNGTVVYVPGTNNDLVDVERNGATHVLLAERRRCHNPRISPDARQVVFDDVTADGRDVWLYSEGTKSLTRVRSHSSVP